MNEAKEDDGFVDLFLQAFKGEGQRMLDEVGIPLDLINRFVNTGTVPAEFGKAVYEDMQQRNAEDSRIEEALKAGTLPVPRSGWENAENILDDFIAGVGRGATEAIRDPATEAPPDVLQELFPNSFTAQIAGGIVAGGLGLSSLARTGKKAVKAGVKELSQELQPIKRNPIVELGEEAVLGEPGAVVENVSTIKSSSQVSADTLRESIPVLREPPLTIAMKDVLSDEAGAILPDVQKRLFAKAGEIGLSGDDLVNIISSKVGRPFKVKGEGAFSTAEIADIEQKMVYIKNNGKHLTIDQKSRYLQDGTWPETKSPVQKAENTKLNDSSEIGAIKLGTLTGEKSLRLLGDGGNELADAILSTRRKTYARDNADERILDEIIPDLTDDQDRQLQAFLDKGIEPQDPVVAVTVGKARKFLDNKRAEAVDIDLDVGYTDNYLPRWIDAEVIDESSEDFVNAILKKAGQEGVPMAPADAMKIVQQIRARSVGRKAGPIEKARTLDLPENLYNNKLVVTTKGIVKKDMTTKEILSRYARTVNKRLEEVAHYGKRDEILTGLSKADIIENNAKTNPGMARSFTETLQRLKKERGLDNPDKARVDAGKILVSIRVKFAQVRSINKQMDKPGTRAVQSVKDIFRIERDSLLKSRGKKALRKGELSQLMTQAKKIRGEQIAAREKTLDTMRAKILSEIDGEKELLEQTTLNAQTRKDLREEAANIVQGNKKELNELHKASQDGAIINRIAAEFGDNGTEYAQEMFDRMVGKVKTVGPTGFFKRVEEDISPHLRSFRNVSTFGKLGGAVVPNTLQTMAILYPVLAKQGLIRGADTYLKALKATFGKDRLEARKFAESAGAIHEGMAQELAHLSTNTLSAATKTGKFEVLTRKLASGLLDATKFSAMEQLNNIIAASAGKIHAEKLIPMARAGNAGAKSELIRMGKAAGMPKRDIDEVIEIGADDEALRAFGYGLARLTQFRADAIDLPLPMFFNSEAGKFVFQFKSFTASTVRWLFDNLGKGNTWAQRSKFLTGLAAGGYGAGTIIEVVREDIPNYLLGREDRKGKEDTGFVRDIIDKVGSAGSFGAYGSFIQALAYRSGADFLAGPNISPVIGGMQNVAGKADKGDYLGAAVEIPKTITSEVSPYFKPEIRKAFDAVFSETKEKKKKPIQSSSSSSHSRSSRSSRSSRE